MRAARLCAIYGIYRVHEMAQEILQDAAVKLARYWAKTDHPRAYMYRVLTTEAIDARRRYIAGKLGPQDLDGTLDGRGREPVDPSTPEAAALLDEVRRALRAALHRLPKRQRQVVTYRMLLGLTTEETAELLKIPSGAVRSALCRGLATLRSMLPRERLDDLLDDLHDDGPGWGPEGDEE